MGYPGLCLRLCVCKNLSPNSTQDEVWQEF